MTGSQAGTERHEPQVGRQQQVQQAGKRQNTGTRRREAGVRGAWHTAAALTLRLESDERKGERLGKKDVEKERWS